MKDGCPPRHADSQSGGDRARELGLFTASTIVYQGARFLFTLAAARVLAPAEFTMWAITIALLVYAPAILLGTNNGMARELPMMIGAGRHATAERTVAATWTATGAAVALMVVATVVVSAVAPILATGAMSFGALASGTVVFGVQQFVLRSRLRFDSASLQQAVFGILVIIAAVVLGVRETADYAFVALLYGGPLVAAVVVGFVVTPTSIPVRFDLGEIRRLAGVGLPIMLAGLLFSVFVTLDRWIAITLLGSEDAAPYALASLFAAAMLVVPTVVSQQTYPRMAIARGRGAAAEELLALARRQGILAAALAMPIAAALIVFAIVGIPLLLPAYGGAIPPVIVLSFGFIVLGFLTGYGNFLNVVGAQWRYLAAQIAGAAIAVILMLIGGIAFGLTGIAAGMAGSHVVYGVLLRAIAIRSGISMDGAPARRFVN